jgi:hypothetical protein
MDIERRSTDDQIIGFLKQAAGIACRFRGQAQATR